ncbi:DUF6020 family protein [Lactobacillaceae bacterium L1_55_11]|nr:DUF6020 family protein [Lactobacillaceae bacterium L1_55_11]
MNRKKIVSGFFFILSYFAVAITYPKVISGNGLINHLSQRLSVTTTESLLGMLIFFLLLLFKYKYDYDVFQKKFWSYWFFGVVTSLLYVLTLSVYQNTTANLSGKVNIVITVVAILGFTFIFSNLALFLSILLDKVKINHWRIKYPYVVIALVIIWTVQIFPLMPGMVSWDGYREFLEYFHTHIAQLNFSYYPTNHHPWSATLMLGFLFSFGRAIGGPNAGLFVIVLFQLVVSALIYAKVIEYVGQNWGKVANFVTFIFYASPFVAFWQVTIEKTPFFLAFSTWFVLCYVKILMAKVTQNIAPRWYIGLITSGILMSMFRNDGAYVVVLSLLSLIIVQSIRYKHLAVKLTTGSVVFLAIFLSWNKVALPAMHVLPGSPGETITLPMRQLSIVVMNKPYSFTQNDLSTINKITPIKKIPANFNINHADDLKSLYPVDSFLRSTYEIKQVEKGNLEREPTSKTKKETNAYLKIWFQQFFKHPKTYAVVFLTANSQFLNPIIDSDPGSRGIMYGNDYMGQNKFLQPNWYSKIHYWFPKITRKYIEWPNLLFKMPIIRTVLQPAFVLWMVLFSLAYFVRRKSYLIVSCVPIGLLASVALLSPVNGAERYMLPAIVALPLLIVVLANTNRISHFKKP